VDTTDRPYSLAELPLPVAVSIAPRTRVARHIILLALTFITATITGAAQSITLDIDSLADFLFGSYRALIELTLAGDLTPLFNGLLFSTTLLLILGAHEMGHYLACRYYGIRATLPFFIPAPPYPLTPFGTFGAVIKIKDPMWSRRALFDIGIAGPLAGFVLAIPASLAGLFMAQPAESTNRPGAVIFHDPLLFRLIIETFDLPRLFTWNPFYWAAWGALLVTALNLFPVGQLDGGHVLYAVLGRRLHKWISWIVCIGVITLATTSWLVYESPIWFLWAGVLLFLAKIGHPPTMRGEPLGKGRITLAVVALIVFLLCFMPFPIEIIP
jgi:membrane-associated protease RseP (regulator of RpoE activity)